MVLYDDVACSFIDPVALNPSYIIIVEAVVIRMDLCLSIISYPCGTVLVYVIYLNYT